MCGECRCGAREIRAGEKYGWETEDAGHLEPSGGKIMSENGADCASQEYDERGTALLR